MVTTLPQQVEKTIQARALLTRGDRVLMATSGGVDSMVLLHLFHTIAPAHGWQLSVAHLNHRLRGHSSDADARFVERTARRLGLPFICESANVKSHAAASGSSVEMAARELRHAFLARTARKLGIRCVALAHHADDQVELFFLRVIRGAGGDGIGGMKWQNSSPVDAGLKLIRPMLDISKASLLDFARSNRIRFREDATNADTDMLRNRIRNKLLPLLRDQFEPALNSAVLRVMELTGDEAAFTDSTACEWLRRKKPGFAKLAVAVQRRVLRNQLRSAGVAAGFDLVESLRRSPRAPMVIRSGTGAIHDGLGTVTVQNLSAEAFKPDQFAADMKGSSGKVIFGRFQIVWRRTSVRGQALETRRKGVEFFDADKVGSRILLRHWRAGDRFQPIGMKQTVKLQDWFTNRKISRSRRRELMIATTEFGEIFWIEGERISERFKLTATTCKRLTWKWTREPN